MRGRLRQRGEDRGVIAVYFSLLMVVFIGLSSLVVDVGVAYANRRQMQNAADAASLAASQKLADALFRQPTVDFAAAQQVASIAAQTVVDNAGSSGAQAVASGLYSCTVVNRYGNDVAPCSDWTVWTDPQQQAVGVRVQTGRTVATFFGGIFGAGSTTARTVSAARVEPLIAGSGPFLVCAVQQYAYSPSGSGSGTGGSGSGKGKGKGTGTGTGNGGGNGQGAINGQGNGASNGTGVGAGASQGASNGSSGKAKDNGKAKGKGKGKGGGGSGPRTPLPDLLTQNLATGRWQANPLAVNTAYQYVISGSQTSTCGISNSAYMGLAADPGSATTIVDSTGAQGGWFTVATSGAPGPARAQIAAGASCANLDTPGCTFVTPVCLTSTAQGQTRANQLWCVALGSFTLTAVGPASGGDVSYRLATLQGWMPMAAGQGGSEVPLFGQPVLIKLMQ